MTRVLELRPGIAAPMGEDVAEVQSLLVLRGELKSGDTVTAQEIAAQMYGVCTVEAVKEFQTQYGLTVDGVVGPATLNALHHPSDTQGYTMPPAYGAMNVLEAEVARVAWQEFSLGVREVPLGANRGPDVDRYLQWYDPPRPGYPGSTTYFHDPDDPTIGAKWCGLFVAACIEWACKRLNKPDPTCPKCGGAGGGSTSCTCLGWNPIRHWGTGAWVPGWWPHAAHDLCVVNDTKPGQVALLGTETNLRHITLVANVYGDQGKFGTIEGNCKNGVRSQVRLLNEIAINIKLPTPWIAT